MLAIACILFYPSVNASLLALAWASSVDPSGFVDGRLAMSRCYQVRWRRTHSRSLCRRRTYHQVSEENSDGYLPYRRHIYRSLLLDGGPIKVPVRREVDADSTVANELGWYLVVLRGDTADYDIADWDALLQAPALLVLNLMSMLFDALATGEDLDAGDVDRIDSGAIVGKQRSHGPPVDFRSVDDRYGLTKEPVSGRQDGVVDMEVFQNLDHSQRRARQDRLLQVLGRVQESHVVVHVVDVLVAQSFYILLEGDGLLYVFILRRVPGEYGIVDENAVDVIVLVSTHHVFFHDVLVNLTKIKVDAAEID